MTGSDYVLWFFSTCAQTFAGLVSVFGMFILYRLQIEEGRIGHLRERMVLYHEDHRTLPLESILRELKRLESEHRERNELEQSEHIKALIKDYGGAIAKRAWLAHSAKRPILMIVSLILLSLLGLVLYPLYAGAPSVVQVVLWGTLALSAVPLYEVGLIIFVSIRSD